MEERNTPAEQENKKKPYKKPEIVTEEMFARAVHCAKCDTGPVQDPGCSIFGDPANS